MENQIKNSLLNKTSLTKMNQNVSHKNLYLAISAALLLTGCETTNDLLGMVPGNDRTSYMQSGRRAPAYNANSGAKPSAAAAMPNHSAPSQQAEVKKPAAKDPYNAYDRYDSSGNEIVAEESNSGGNFFTDMFSKKEAAPQQAETRTPDMYAQRKPLPGNPPLAKNTYLRMPEPKAPEPMPEPLVNNTVAPTAAPAPAMEHSEAKAENIQPVPASVMEPVKEQLATAPVEKAPVNEAAKEPVKEVVAEHTEAKAVIPASNEVAAEPEKETLLGRMGSRIFDSKKSETDSAIQQDAEYPKIASVPPKPEKFEEIKNDKQQNLNNLQYDHFVANQEKKSLDHEVSPETTPAPVAMEAPQPMPVPSAAKETVATAPSATAEAPKAAAQEPVVAKAEPVRPVSDSSASVANTQASESKNEHVGGLVLSSSVGDTSNTVNPPVAVEVKDENGLSSNSVASWFSSIGSTPSAPTDSSAAAAKPAEVQPSSSEPELVSDPNIYVPSTPSSTSASSSVSEPSPVPSIQPVTVEATAASEPAKEEQHATKPQSGFAPASSLMGDAQELPSPDIIKNIRPSRYASRRNQPNTEY